MELWSNSECQNILGFLGYGSPAAPLWLIGQEEGLGGKMPHAEQVRNLRNRGKWKSIMDLSEAHMTLTEDGSPIDISKPRKGSTAVWLWMSRIARAYEGQSDWNKLDLARHYMRTRLGRREDGQTFMTELSPVAKKELGEGSWLRELLSQPNADQYLKHRERSLRNLLQVHQPKMVVCYGTTGKAKFAHLLGLKEWLAISPTVSISSSGNHFLLPYFGQGQKTNENVETLVNSDGFQRLAKRES